MRRIRFKLLKIFAPCRFEITFAASYASTSVPFSILPRSWVVLDFDFISSLFPSTSNKTSPVFPPRGRFQKRKFPSPPATAPPDLFQPSVRAQSDAHLCLP